MSAIVYVVYYGYDGLTHAFTDEDQAREHVAELIRADESAGYYTLLLDPPKRSRRGAYCVEVNARGEVVEEGWTSYCAPDHHWADSPVPGCHYWKSGEEMRATEAGAVIRSHGIDRDEAMERATAMLDLFESPPSTDALEGAR